MVEKLKKENISLVQSYPISSNNYFKKREGLYWLLKGPIEDVNPFRHKILMNFPLWAPWQD